MIESAKRKAQNSKLKTVWGFRPSQLCALSCLLCALSFSLSSCKWKMHPTYPANQIADNLRHLCSKDYKLSVETRHEQSPLQAVVCRAGLFGGHAYDLQGMSDET